MTIVSMQRRHTTRRISPREREVLEFVADGHSTAEIARALWITEDTVRTHVKRILVRLKARTRAHAVSIAYREGLFLAADERRSV